MIEETTASDVLLWGLLGAVIGNVAGFLITRFLRWRQRKATR